MREIKFRGKRVDNGEWIYGYLIVKAGMPFIFSFGVIEPILVISETIGQYTGLKDKNGVEIYEGDIVEVEEEHYQYNEVLTNKYQATVVFREGCYNLVEENGLMDIVYNKADKCKVQHSRQGERI